MKKSYRLVIEADIDAESPESAAIIMYQGLLENKHQVFAVYEWENGTCHAIPKKYVNVENLSDIELANLVPREQSF